MEVDLVVVVVGQVVRPTHNITHPTPLDHPMMIFTHPPNPGALAARHNSAAGRSSSPIAAHPPLCAVGDAPSALHCNVGAPSLVGAPPP